MPTQFVGSNSEAYSDDRGIGMPRPLPTGRIQQAKIVTLLQPSWLVLLRWRINFAAAWGNPLAMLVANAPPI